MWMLPALGLGAGALSTVAGMGGGILLVLTISLAADPITALAATAPALLAANLHRLWLFRGSLDRRVAGVFVAGAFPGALVGSLVAVSLPAEALPWILLAVSALAVARALGWLRWSPGPRSLAPAGVVAGGVAATSGAGVFVSPLLLAAGLRGDAFIATASASAAAMHVARILGYGAGGAIDASTFGLSALLMIGLVAGNLVGRRIRDRIGERGSHRVTYGVMGAMLLLALAGIR
ncbi:MAG: sulfite exporter TauE/SafE family protein [Myxococcota bacterium]|nr:sulfite exporter TauE/SafE family protein [Myxococcota bacterium]